MDEYRKKTDIRYLREVFRAGKKSVHLFGKGKKQLIMIAGLGDGLKTVKGMALPFSIMYYKYTKEYTVTVISRNNTLKENDTTKDMAIDLKKVMNLLNIKKAEQKIKINVLNIFFFIVSPT